MQDEEIQETSLPGKETAKEWIMYFDGAFSLQGAGAGVLLVAPIGEHVKYVVQMHFLREKATNNIAEYEGLLTSLRIAVDLGIRKLIIYGDSQLVVKQVNKDYQSPLMEAYVEEVRKLEEHFDGLQTEHIPCAENSIADHLSKCAAQKLLMEPGTFVLHLTQPSVTPSMQSSKRRKLNTGKYFPAELPEAVGKEVAGNSTVVASEQQPLAELQVLVVETSAPAPKEMPLVLVVEPQAPAWV
jgi:ribonuclease HI